MTTNGHATLRLLRKLHLYIGIFISPALLFFALTGALQTFSLHETVRGSDYKPAHWIVTLAQIHKKQTTVVPQRKPQPGQDGTMDKHDHGAATVDAPKAPAVSPRLQHLPLKLFFLLVSLGLFISTLTGIYMSYKFVRGKVLVTGLLVAGVVVPLVLLAW